MAEEEEENQTGTHQPAFPASRVKKIMKLDEDINKVTSEAIYLVSRAAELFTEFLAEKSAQVTVEKKRRTVRLDHLRVAVRRHQPTSDFLLDSLPVPSQPSDRPSTERARSRLDNKPAPAGTRRIDHFFQKES
ncbi:hypothetical protein RJ640_030836 [Escallonia rubra]|uniref:Transcription factor CBF/NF-Y/archaeal histone domain-containing protein n=1 Tax=Escallonia rubra TaxID=112253 RepID=A0AA88R2N4_9ASTE|nr:hypothetical protein RJ640_030836 [Escallonia rubra]